MTIRVAVIGAGIMGTDHARVIAEDVPGATLQVVCDVSESAARAAANACSATGIATDADATIRRADVDAVIIASPDGTHADLTLTALELEKPVLCEKPLALTAGDCLRIVSAEAAIGRPLIQVGFMRRFDPAYVEMKQALASGRIGAPVMMHNFHRNVEAPSGFTGMMAITNSAPHEFDIIRHMLDCEITAVTAFEPKADAEGPCKPVVLVTETADGQIAMVEVNNNAAYGYDVRCELVGASGSVSFGGATSVSVDAELSGTRAYAADWRPRFADAYRLQNKAWIRSITTGAPNPIAATAWDGYCAAVIAAAGTEALSSGTKVRVELADKPALHAETGRNV